MSAAAEQATVPARQELLQEQLKSSSLMKRTAATVDAMEDIVFGSLAGIAGKFIEYPFDTVKVRLQSQPNHLPLRYTGPLECFRQSIRADGILGLYRGISAPLVGAALDVGSLFFFERVAQRGLFAAGLYKPEDKLPLSALFFTGAVAGAFTSLVLTPIELVKCRIQVPTVSLTDGTINRAPKPIEIIRQIYRHGGLLGFWHGQFGTLIRETGGSAAWFGGKQTVTEMFRHVNKSKSDPSDALEPLPLWQQAIAGAAAGVSYNFSTYPADTIKSRMQCASPNSASQTFWQEGIALWKQHGLRGMYRGCGITLVRSAPSSAFIFILYDAMKREFHFA